MRTESSKIGRENSGPLRVGRVLFKSLYFGKGNCRSLLFERGSKSRGPEELHVDELPSLQRAATTTTSPFVLKQKWRKKAKIILEAYKLFLQNFVGMLEYANKCVVLLPSHPSFHQPHEFFGRELFFATTPATAAEDKAADQKEEGSDHQDSLLKQGWVRFFWGGFRVFASFTTTSYRNGVIR